MKSALSSLTFLTLAASAAVAQTTTNSFHVYTGSTSFTSRGFLGGAAGETLQGYPAAHYRGIGDDATLPKSCTVFGFAMTSQDQNQTTLEQYRVMIRADDGTGQPDGSDAGVILETGLVDLPVGTGSGAAAWNVTVNLGSGGVQVPCNETYYAGIALSANANWTSDGQSTWASAYTAPSATTGDPVRDGAQNNAWQVDAMGAVRNTNPRSWNYQLLTERGAFQIGILQDSTATTGLYGSGGNYPDTDTHGLSFRLRDAAMADDLAAVFVSTDLIGGMPIPFDGTLWVNPGTFVNVATGKLDSTGELELLPDVFAPGKLKALKGLGYLPFQAVILDIGDQRRLNLRTMNAQATSL